VKDPSGLWLLRAPFFALPPEQNDHQRWNNTEYQQAPQRFVIADRVPKYHGEPHHVHQQCKPENSAPLFPIHNDPTIAQTIIDLGPPRGCAPSFRVSCESVGDGDHHRAASTSFTSALSKKSDGGLEDCLPAPSYVALIYHRHRHFPYPRRVRESHVPSPQSPLSVSSQPGALVLKPTLPGRSSLRSYPINPCVF